MKDMSWTRYFNPGKSLPKLGSEIHQRQKLRGRLVWCSKNTLHSSRALNKGTYVRSKHGILKNGGK